MLSMMTLAYYRMPEQAALSLATAKWGRTLLFYYYVERMVRYRGGESIRPTYPNRSLAGLAGEKTLRRLIRRFFLAHSQPNWLPRDQQRQLPMACAPAWPGCLG